MNKVVLLYLIPNVLLVAFALLGLLGKAAARVSAFLSISAATVAGFLCSIVMMTAVLAEWTAGALASFAGMFVTGTLLWLALRKNAARTRLWETLFAVAVGIAWSILILRGIWFRATSFYPHV